MFKIRVRPQLSLVGHLRGGQISYSTNTSNLTTPWNILLQFPKFNDPFARIDSIDYSMTGSAAFFVELRNFTPSNDIVVVTATNRLLVNKPSGNLLSSMNFSNSKGDIIPFGGKIIASSTNAVSSGTIPSLETGSYVGSGTVSLTAIASAGKFFITTNQSFVTTNFYNQSISGTLTYTFTPIGLTQEDPIFPTSSTATNATFTSAPTGRWFSSTSSPAIQFNMTTTGATFIDVMAFPTNFGTAFGLTISNVDFGPFSPGQSFVFPGAGVRTFTLIAENSGFPIQIGLSLTNATFKMTPIYVAPTISSIVISNGIVNLSWGSVTGAAYQVQYKPAFNLTNWFPVGNKMISTGSLSSFIDSNMLSSSRFYRIAVVP